MSPALPHGNIHARMRDRLFFALAWAAFFLLCWVSLVRNDSPLERLPAPSLTVTWGQGAIQLAGELPDEVTKARLGIEVERLDPSGTVVNLVTVGSADPTGSWIPTVVGVVRAVSGKVGKGELRFTPATVTVGGEVRGHTDRTEVIAASRAAAGGELGVSDQLTVTNAAPPSKAPRSPSEVQSDLRRLLAGRSIDFESGSAVLTPPSRALLDEIVPLFPPSLGLNLAIDGHTDASGRPDDNLTLSEQRATAVRNYLIARGLLADRVTAQGFGSSRPLADNGTPAGRKLNRRIEFRVARP